jgi:hypothetical protein
MAERVGTAWKPEDKTMQGSYAMLSLIAAGLAAAMPAPSAPTTTESQHEQRQRQQQQQQQQWEHPPGTRPTSVEARLEALERLAAAEGKSIERSLSVRVTRLEHRILGQESNEIETEGLGTTIGTLERTTRLLEGRIASLERARSTPGAGGGSEELAALRRSVDRLSSAVDDLEDRVRRLELRRP